MNYEVGYKEYCCISCGFSWKDMLDAKLENAQDAVAKIHFALKILIQEQA